MQTFISLSNTKQLNDHHIKLENIGKQTGFLGLGQKTYLVYNENKEDWGVENLNLFQRILRRVFGFYQETHHSEVKRLLDAHSLKECEATKNTQFIERIANIWNIHFPLEEESSSPSSSHETHSPQLVYFNQSKSDRKSPPFFKTISKRQSTCIYDSATHQFKNRDPEVEKIATQFQIALLPANLKNIQTACLFGDWKGMGFNINHILVKKGKGFTLLQKIATEIPELGNYIFLNKRGNGECGYRTIVDGLIHGDCIRQDNIDKLKEIFQNAFDHLIESWNALPFDPLNPAERNLFEISKDRAFAQLDRMKKMNTAYRITLLQEETPFLAPFLSFIRCITVSQTKLIESEKIDEQTLANVKRTNEILALLRDKANFTALEEKNLSYAVKNYSPEALLNDAELTDIIGNGSENLLKKELKKLVKRAFLADEALLTELTDLVVQGDELSNKENILTAPLAEMLDMGISRDEFLKQKALGDANSPRSLWAIGSDFTAIGYALNKNICCIYRDQYKDDAFGIQKTYRNQAADFYGLNMTGQVHYNALLPLMIY